MHRVDLFPTHEYQGLKLRPGRPYPFGATVFGNMVNFCVVISHLRCLNMGV